MKSACNHKPCCEGRHIVITKNWTLNYKRPVQKLWEILTIPVSGMEVTSIGRKRRIAIYDYSTTPGEPEMVISSKSQYMPSDWFSYCTLKTFNSTEDCSWDNLEQIMFFMIWLWYQFHIEKRLDDRCSRNGRDVDCKGRRPLKYRWASYLHKQICERSYLLKLQESRGSTKA